MHSIDPVANLLDRIASYGQRMTMMRKPVQYYGGKGRILKKILPFVPEGGRPYCEPYFGSGSVFFAREPASAEVINDIDDGLINLFRCLQNKEHFKDLKHRIVWTPYSRAEFTRAIGVIKTGSDDPVELAWAYFVALNQSMSGRYKCPGNWSRTFVTVNGVAKAVNDWLMRQYLLDAWRWRLMHAQIDNRDALEVIRYWDSPETVFYLDPPYLLETRRDANAYRHEASNQHHAELIELILKCQGAVTLSGYANEIYAKLERHGWIRRDWATDCAAAVRFRGSGLQGKGAAKLKVPRTESVWVNPKAIEMLERKENRRWTGRHGSKDSSAPQSGLLQTALPFSS